MAYQLSHMIIVTEFTCSVSHTATKGNIVFNMSVYIYHTAYIRIIVFIPSICFVYTLRQCLI